jgi:hypothetical protein
MFRQFLWVLWPLALSVPAAAQTVVGPGSPCEQAGRDAERDYALPIGLLGAIGKVESGRWDPTVGRVVPSPWAIDASGQPYLSDNKASALQMTHALQDGGMQNIDVGCFQINLKSHPAAFTDLEQAFDPVANAQYAAKFLSSLHARLGNWPDAVAAYHSATPALGVPYQQAVYSNWTVPEGWQQAIAGSPRLAQKVADPVTVFSVRGMVIRIWTPSGSGGSTAAVAAAVASMPGLPKVITPGG